MNVTTKKLTEERDEWTKRFEDETNEHSKN